MAVLQALFTALARSAGNLLNRVFGWATVLLFGAGLFRGLRVGEACHQGKRAAGDGGNGAMDVGELLLTAARAAAVYLFVLLVVRILGKREVGNITAFDLIVAFMIGEMVDEPIWGDTTLTKAFVAIGIVGLCHRANAWASSRSQFIDRVTGAEPTVLVQDGHILEEALAHERMNEEDLQSQLRLQGVDKLEEVRQATLEPNGQVSVLKQEWAEPIRKGDLRRCEPGG